MALRIRGTLAIFSNCFNMGVALPIVLVLGATLIPLAWFVLPHNICTIGT